ncbi:MAG: RdgB/HAM1 family non-canonical purine NTP pyrophosphatase [Candidatus Gastranaerophilales bacterium]|nr:RdgB/HAM1 family non-canonical purine NTP pyrophosphatase [Candidatus Gastranaerophilales bacterium]
MVNNLQKNIIIATANPHKLEEIAAINNIETIKFDIVKGDFHPVENGTSYFENAYIKAYEAAKLSDSYCLADDSGLCVDVLNGAPGLYSARYAGSQKEKIEKLLQELKHFPLQKRTAHFVSVMVLVDSKGNVVHQTEGKIEGLIIDTPRGSNGFGYDPIFHIPEYNQTMAEMNSELKNKISHRANALIPMLDWISNNI